MTRLDYVRCSSPPKGAMGVPVTPIAPPKPQSTENGLAKVVSVHVVLGASNRMCVCVTAEEGSK